MINKVSFAVPNNSANKVGFKGEKEVQALIKEANSTKLNQLAILCDKVELRLEKKELTPEDVEQAAEQATHKLVKKGLKETAGLYRERYL